MLPQPASAHSDTPGRTLTAPVGKDPRSRSRTRERQAVSTVEIPGDVRPHPPAADGRRFSSRADSTTEAASEAPLSPEARTNVKPAEELLVQPVRPRRPGLPPNHRQGNQRKQDKGTTVEIGAVIIETSKAPGSPQPRAVPPRGRRGRRPGSQTRESRDRHAHQKAVSRLTFGLGAL
jgi:hypothetical protein